MTLRISRSTIGIWAIACLLALSTSAFAALGDNAASVLQDQARMRGSLRSTDHHAYVMHEITASTGAKLREYVSPAGQVFGVAWEGQFPPNFQQVLGPYYQQAQEAITQQKADAEANGQVPRRRGPAYVNTPGLVLVQGGHMHSYHGQAYIPQLLPQGVTPSDIR